MPKVLLIPVIRWPVVHVFLTKPSTAFNSLQLNSLPPVSIPELILQPPEQMTLPKKCLTDWEMNRDNIP
ncbi:hypothetical protein TNCT_617481 [Trichonephila clavata]|uniref:Uncharacterized protein n=1 Tax=Trichonephila clavata TaxID=2740835 RepID=A0A8X6GQ15_TRICU|nr:hypothetical protein TNCT_617481 [Trichonephila clavata]